jgi:hypothetical protein
MGAVLAHRFVARMLCCTVPEQTMWVVSLFVHPFLDGGEGMTEVISRASVRYALSTRLML